MSRSNGGCGASGMNAELPAAIGIDTNCFIYFFDDGSAGPRPAWLRANVFEPLAAGRRRGVTSTLTVSELLVRPYADAQPDRAAALRAALTAFPTLAILPVTMEIADGAARLRAAHDIRLPDAIQLATTHAGGGQAFLTNDRALAHADPGLPVLILDELVTA